MATAVSTLLVASTLLPTARVCSAFLDYPAASSAPRHFGQRHRRPLPTSAPSHGNLLLAASSSTLVTDSSSPQIWIEPAEDGFVDHDENLEEGEILVKAVKAFSANQDNDDKKFLCAGALIQRPPSPTSTDVNMTIYDAWMADAIMDGNGGPNLQIQGAMGILDELYRHFLSTDNRNMPWGGVWRRCTVGISGIILSTFTKAGGGLSAYLHQWW